MVDIKQIQGGLAVDDRGTVSFVNDFNPSLCGVKRFYMVENHEQGFVRAWHGHKNEGKYIFVVSGSIKVGIIPEALWDSPGSGAVKSFVLSEKKPQVLYVPPGNANGFMSLSENAKVIFYSTSSVEESLGDDYRFPAERWNIWTVERR